MSVQPGYGAEAADPAARASSGDERDTGSPHTCPADAHPVTLLCRSEVRDVRAGDLDALAAAATALSRWLIAAPDAATANLVRDAAVLEQWPLPPAGATAVGLKLLADSARSAEDAVTIAADRTHLFVGPGHVPAPPYESVHRSADGLLFDQETLQVRAWYRRFGLRAPRSGREPDDHIGLELEFLAQLLAWALDALDDEDPAAAAEFTTAAAQFLDEHLARWAPTLFAGMLEHSVTDFYRGVAHLGVGFVQETERVLGAPR